MGGEEPGDSRPSLPEGGGKQDFPAGRYRLLRKLGEGGMGEVWAAHDERLERAVALKRIRQGMADAIARQRFWREARTAASVSHPNVCQIYEIAEEDGELLLVMELLEGEPLSERLKRGPLLVAEALPLILEVLSALEALHGRAIVHRDLKPSNVFLTKASVKLLDFGLARPLPALSGTPEHTVTELTLPGMVAGTPHYMSPEQLRGESVDARSDLYAVGVMLFEMLAGRRAFDGRSMADLVHAVLHEQPAALAGSQAVVAVDRVIRRALSKRAPDRHPTGAEMARELRECLLVDDSGQTVRTRAITRLIVLPFRVLRPDPDVDFLSFGLSDAITASLAGLESLSVRSSLAAARFTAEAPDLKRIASEIEVDVVLSGTLLRSGDKLRVSTQLVEAPGGALVWSQTTEVTTGEIFSLQDALVQRLVESLSVPLTAREHKLLRRDVPATARAYEMYLRANSLAREAASWEVARDLYEACVEEDPRYAPSWARLGRVYRLLAKYRTEDSEAHLAKAGAAFRRALELNPDLGLAHSLFSALEVEAGRSLEAMRKLLERTRETRGVEPEVFAALVPACRYCGLLEASIAADARAHRLDPGIRTSVAYTHFLLADYEKAIASDKDEERFITSRALLVMGRIQEAMAGHRTRTHPFAQLAADGEFAAVEGRREAAIAAVDELARFSGFRDPEGFYYIARTLTRVGALERGLDLLEKVVEAGFHPLTGFTRDSWLDPARTEPRFRELLKRAEAQQRVAQDAFMTLEGERLLGK